ncbi:MAG: hypothetical protein IJB89_07390 [Akkermansia sp.]|nr:hypothetical protein [Akkermansia sp.]
MSVAQVATLLQRHRSTVYWELKGEPQYTKEAIGLSFGFIAHKVYLLNSGAGDPYLKLRRSQKLATLMADNKRSPYDAIQTDRPEKMITPFHRLNEEVTKMQTVSSGSYYPRKYHSIRSRKTISTVLPNGCTVTLDESSADDYPTQWLASKTCILSN